MKFSQTKQMPKHGLFTKIALFGGLAAGLLTSFSGGSSSAGTTPETTPARHPMPRAVVSAQTEIPTETERQTNENRDVVKPDPETLERARASSTAETSRELSARVILFLSGGYGK